jgi:hypothetical protein
MAQDGPKTDRTTIGGAPSKMYRAGHWWGWTRSCMRAAGHERHDIALNMRMEGASE